MKFNEPNIIGICRCAVRKRSLTLHSTYVFSYSVTYLPHRRNNIRTCGRKHKAISHKRGVEKDWSNCKSYSRLLTHSFRLRFHINSQGSFSQRWNMTHSLSFNTSISISHTSVAMMFIRIYERLLNCTSA
jgi:hypothetical protein